MSITPISNKHNVRRPVQKVWPFPAYPNPLDTKGKPAPRNPDPEDAPW